MRKRDRDREKDTHSCVAISSAAGKRVNVYVSRTNIEDSYKY
jgi:hypothetical protein